MNSGGTALSYWHDSLEPDDDGRPRPALDGDLDVDVAIVGAGFTGLWTAYYLRREDPGLRVAVLEASSAGFGASGRNGGWCVGDQAARPSVLEKSGGSGAAGRMIRAVQDCVDEVGRVCAEEDIDCGFAKGGALYLAFNRGQLARLEKLRKGHERHGLTGSYELLSATQTAEVVRAEGVIGGLRLSHAAAVHPARLARGVARAAERHGAVIYEQMPVVAVAPGSVRTAGGSTVKASVIVRATEGYTRTLEGERRSVVPLANIMIATEPIDASTWDAIGLAGRELFEDCRLLVGYGQRTADGRLAWGGLDGQYRWGSRIPDSPMRDDRLAARLQKRLVELFPMLAGIGISHQWGGVLGVPRDLRPSVGLDRATGLAWAGGYFGSGVAIANLSGRTLTDLITHQSTDLTSLPWVGHQSRRWEPEPYRWLGVVGGLRAAGLNDFIDRRRG